MSRRLAAAAGWGLLLASGFFLLYLLVTTAWLALSDAVIGGAAPAFTGSENILRLIRSVLFRRAAGNTAQIVSVALLISLPAAVALSALMQPVPAKGNNSQGDNSSRFLLACGLLPLIMPVAVAAWAWHELFLLVGALPSQSQIGLLLSAVVQAWRTLPIVLLVLLAPVALSPWLHRALAGLAGVWWILADACVALLITGGEPYNGTHTLASWTYMTAVTGGSAGLGAAVAMVWMAVLAAPIALLLWWTEPRNARPASRVSRPSPLIRQRSSRILLGVPAVCWLLLPLFVLLVRSGGPAGWISAWPLLMGETVFPETIVRTMLLLVWMTTAAAAAIALVHRPASLPRHQTLGWWRRGLSWGILLPALVILPVAFVPGVWIAGVVRTPALVRPEWLLTLAAVAAGLGATALAARTHPLARRRVVPLAGGLALVIVAQTYGSVFALTAGPTTLVTTAFVSTLAYRSDYPPAVPALAGSLTTLLFTAIGLILLLAWATNPPAPNTAVPSSGKEE